MKTELITSKYILDKEVVVAQMTLLCNFVHSLAFYRVISQDYDRIKDNKKFWTQTMNSCYLRAITDWCIVFGSNNNEVHWKKTAKNKQKEFISEIRSMTYVAAEISKKKWEKYHKEVVDFRNKYAAHKNIDYIDNVPHLEMAYKVSRAYFEWLKKILQPATNEPKSLDIQFPEFQIEAIVVLNNDLEKI